MRRAVLAAVAVALLVGSGSVARAGIVSFDVTGNAGTQSSLQFTGSDGSTVMEVTGARTDGGGAAVHQWGWGLGVDSTSSSSSWERKIVTKPEILWVKFDRTVWIKEMVFAKVDDWRDGDELKVVDGDGNMIGIWNLADGMNRLGFTWQQFNGALHGNKFGLTVTDWDDGWSIEKVKIHSVVPIPTVASSAGVMLAVLGFAHRRRKALD